MNPSEPVPSPTEPSATQRFQVDVCEATRAQLRAFLTGASEAPSGEAARRAQASSARSRFFFSSGRHDQMTSFSITSAAAAQTNPWIPKGAIPRVRP